MSNSEHPSKNPPPIEDYLQKIYESLERSLSNAEDVANLGQPVTTVTKVGVKLPMSWEDLAGSQRKGHYEPVGNKYTQWVSWWSGKQVFRFWQFIERCLSKFRHYESVGGYEWEDAEYREFKQERKWVEDAEG